jgi:2-oxo-4-hydroxy-4-carboxy--5-ureidoimidazoline (OHCU) decarboxylase
VKQVFAKTKNKFFKADKMEPLLVEESLTPEEAEQAISLARDKKVIRASFPYIDDVHGDRCYEILTKKDREIDKELEKEFLKKRWP